MITAKEAKQLYDESGVEVEKRIATIPLGTLTTFECIDGKTTPLNRAVMSKLAN